MKQTQTHTNRPPQPEMGHDTYQYATLLSRTNADRLYDATGTHVAEALLTYLCNQHRHGGPPDGELDPRTFAKATGFNIRYLITTDTTEKDAVRSFNKRSGHPCDIRDITKRNRFEDAIHSLVVVPLDTAAGQTMRALGRVSAVQDAKTEKITYLYGLTPTLYKHILYDDTPISDICTTKLRKSGLIRCMPNYSAWSALQAWTRNRGTTGTGARSPAYAKKSQNT